MADKPWKHEERVVADMFGTSRQLMKGTSEKSDIISDLFMVDAKLRRRWDINRWYRELKDAAGKVDKVPVLTVRVPGERLRLAVIDLDYLISIMKGARLLEGNNESRNGR